MSVLHPPEVLPLTRRPSNERPLPADQAEPQAAPPTTADPALLEVLSSIDRSLKRIADKVDPPADRIVGTDYIARQLGCTETWIAEQARDGVIPKSCVVPGTGNGRPWKFYREKVEEWLKTRS